MTHIAISSLKDVTLLKRQKDYKAPKMKAVCADVAHIIPFGIYLDKVVNSWVRRSDLRSSRVELFGGQIRLCSNDEFHKRETIYMGLTTHNVIFSNG